MKELSCSECGRTFMEDELLSREDTGELVCPDCSGLLAGEDLGCEYDEVG